MGAFRLLPLRRGYRVTRRVKSSTSNKLKALPLKGDFVGPRGASESPEVAGC